jgi:cyanophycinase
VSESRPGQLVIIGGGEQRDSPGDVLKAFASLLPVPKRVVVCAEASQVPDDMIAMYRGALGPLGCDVRTLNELDLLDRRWVPVLAESGGLFLTGGSQSRLMERIGSAEFVQDLHRRWQAGLIVAGTSAGASVMGRRMIEAGRAQEKPSESNVEIGDGLGFLDVVIDQHFAERGRIHRLLAAVAATGSLGIGIDEDTALLVDGSRFRVVGEGSVTVIDGTDTVFHARPDSPRENPLLSVEHAVVHVLEPGDCFDLSSRQLVAIA